MKEPSSYRQLVILVSEENLALGLKALKGLGLKVDKKIRNRSGVWLMAKTSMEGAKAIMVALSRTRHPESGRRIFPTAKSQTHLKGAEAREFEKSLKIITLGTEKIPEERRLWVDPRGLPSKGLKPHTIYLNYGEAFGAGNHPTTRISAEMLYESIGHFRKPKVLDLGCGTGVLSIAARKWGASQVWAMDNDPTALKAAARNFKKNRVTGIILKERIDTCRLKFQVVIININLKAAILLRKLVDARLHPRGFVILGGIEHHDLDRLLNFYSDFLTVGKRVDGRWTNLLMKKRDPSI